MRRPHVILVPLVLGLLGAPATAQFENAPESTSIPEGGARVELDLSRPIPIIIASVNGSDPLPFFLDTGASGIVLNASFAQALEMEVIGTQDVRDMASGNMLQSDQVRVDRVEIGEAVFTGLSAITMDRTGIVGFAGDAPRGIIGLSTFAQCLVTLDYPNGLLIIEDGELPEPDGQTVLSYASDGESNIPVFTVDVAGTSYTAHIDSGGSSGITLPFDQIENLPLAGEPTVIGRGRGAAGSFEIFGSKLEGSVTMGAFSWESPQVTFIPNVKWVHFGTGALKRFTMTLDQRNRRARFVDPTGVVVDRSQAERPKRYGIRFDPTQFGGEALVVDGVIERMAAEASGLRAGDRILAIDGKSVSGMSQLDLATLFRRSPLAVSVDRDGETLEITLTFD